MKISKIKTLCAAVGIACGALAAPSAQAITFTGTPYIGYVDIDIFGFDSGTTGYTPTGFDPFGPAAQSGTSCTTVAGCNAAGGAPAPNAIGSEDTWGVLRVNQIRDINGDPLWISSATEQLYGMFYGFADQTVEWSTTNTGASFSLTAWSVGGKIKIWEHSAIIGNFGDPGGLGPANRTAADQYSGGGNPLTPLNNGNLWLELDAVGGQSVADTETLGQFTTLQSTFGSTDFSGGSDFFADVVGGSAQSLFYANLPDENGVDRDFFVNNTNKIQGRGSWTVRADTASASHMTIPEPGSMALVGLGLMGLAAMGRRKQS